MSFPMAFLAEKPFVHVRRVPESRAVCSTGNEKVRARGMCDESELSSRTASCDPLGASEGGIALEGEPESVRKVSTESAR